MQIPAQAGRNFLWLTLGVAVPALSAVWVDWSSAGRADAQLPRIFLLFTMLAALGAILLILYRTNRRLELQGKIIEQSSEAAMVLDRGQRILAVNPAFERITGYAADEILGRHPWALGASRHGADAWQAIWRTLTELGQWEGEFWDQRKGGELYPKSMRISALGAGWRQTRYVALFSDVSGQKAQEARIDYLAHHDALTSLPNRVALDHYLDAAIALIARRGDQLAVLIIDLDHFKTVNDSLGHHAGDRLLTEVARRLLVELDESSRLFRLGGDEFVVVLSGLPHLDPVIELVQRLVRAIGEPCRLDGCELHTSPSIGIGIYPNDGEDAQTLLRNADTAMYYAKANGRNNYQFFAEPMNVAVNRRLYVESELWQALGENQLTLHYQPQFDLLNGTMVAVEALVRWQHPQRGMIEPGEFISVAEECGLILPLGQWVLLMACRQTKAWLDAGIALGGVAVNISVHQFRQPEFAQSVHAVLVETGLPAERLELEITESTLMHEPDAAARTMAKLKAMGVKLAVDDFGTGYSSLAYLRRFPVDRLKIDRTFVADIGVDSEGESLVASIVALGHSLGLELVAEGVEQQAQAEYLQLLECQRVQGFHYCRPVAVAELEKLADFRLLQGNAG